MALQPPVQEELVALGITESAQNTHRLPSATE
jgi:hypothetical protein